MNNSVTLIMSPEDAKILMTSIGMLSKQRIRHLHKQDVKQFGSDVARQLYGEDFTDERAYEVTGQLYEKMQYYFEHPDLQIMDQKDSRFGVYFS